MSGSVWNVDPGELQQADDIARAGQSEADKQHNTSLQLTDALGRKVQEQKEQQLYDYPDSDILKAAGTIYQMRQGKPYEGENSDLVKYGMDEMRRFNHSWFQADMDWAQDLSYKYNPIDMVTKDYMSTQDEIGMAGYIKLMESDQTTPDQKLAFLHLMNTYTAVDMDNINEAGSMVEAMVSDPSSLGGIAALASQGFKFAGKKAFASAFRKRLEASIAVSLEGAVFSGGYSYLNQEAAIAASDNDYYSQQTEQDYTQNAIAAGVGGTIGALLPVAPGWIWDGLGWAVDKTYKPGQFGSGVGPTDWPDKPNYTPDTAAVGPDVPALGDPGMPSIGPDPQLNNAAITPDAPVTPATLRDTPHPLGPKVREIADQRIAIAQEAANLNAKKTGSKVKTVRTGVKIDDLAKAFDADHLETYGRKLDPKAPEDQQMAAKVIAKEIDLQMTQANSGAGWYDADVEKTFKLLGETPGLESLKSNETHRIIWSALSAPTSIGQKVIGNTKASTAAALTYFRTGEIPTVAPKAGAITEGIDNAGWGFKQKSVEPGMKVISALIKKHGEEGFADWWLSPHSLKELTAIRKEAGLGGAPTGLSGGKDSIHLGAMVLGDKTGRFSLNINGYEGTTKDVWYSRSYNRAFGQMFGANDPKTGLPVVQGGPRNQAERREMEAFNQLVLYNTNLKGLSEADAQAVLWFYEQGLYSRLGVQSRPGSFSEGVGVVHGSLGIRQAVRGSDGSEAQIEPPADLDNFRNISGKQRTLRANRRDTQSGVDNGAGITESSRPYQREIISNDGGDGLLSFFPDPDTLAKYQSAGLSLPNINQVDSATNATSYNADMTSAMSGHKFGAQVEIKSAEDLLSSKLFRTESGSGFAIKPDGDIVAVFASPNEPKGGSTSMLQAAVQAGGKKLDAFDTYLPRIYKSVGFRPIARLPWNDEFAPLGWDKSNFLEFNNGEPDIIFFVHDSEYFGEAIDVPVAIDYDDAVRLQNEALK